LVSRFKLGLNFFTFFLYNQISELLGLGNLFRFLFGFFKDLVNCFLSKLFSSLKFGFDFLTLDFHKQFSGLLSFIEFFRSLFSFFKNSSDSLLFKLPSLFKFSIYLLLDLDLKLFVKISFSLNHSFDFFISIFELVEFFKSSFSGFKELLLDVTLSWW